MTSATDRPTTCRARRHTHATTKRGNQHTPLSPRRRVQSLKTIVLPVLHVRPYMQTVGIRPQAHCRLRAHSRACLVRTCSGFSLGACRGSLPTKPHSADFGSRPIKAHFLTTSRFAQATQRWAWCAEDAWTTSVHALGITAPPVCRPLWAFREARALRLARVLRQVRARLCRPEA